MAGARPRPRSPQLHAPYRHHGDTDRLGAGPAVGVAERLLPLFSAWLPDQFRRREGCRGHSPGAMPRALTPRIQDLRLRARQTPWWTMRTNDGCRSPPTCGRNHAHIDCTIEGDRERMVGADACTVSAMVCRVTRQERNGGPYSAAVSGLALPQGTCVSDWAEGNCHRQLTGLRTLGRLGLGSMASIMVRNVGGFSAAAKGTTGPTTTGVSDLPHRHLVHQRHGNRYLSRDEHLDSRQRPARLDHRWLRRADLRRHDHGSDRRHDHYDGRPDHRHHGPRSAPLLGRRDYHRRDLSVRPGEWILHRHRLGRCHAPVFCSYVTSAGSITTRRSRVAGARVALGHPRAPWI